MARPRKYTARGLEKAVQAYFQSISRTETVTEDVDSGQRDKMGHRIYIPMPVLNDSGEEVQVTRFVSPPSVGGLCRFLGIHRSTWWEYCDGEKHPELAEVTRWARDTLEGYLEEQALIRAGKDLKGVLFLLQNGYGWSEKRQVELGPRASRAVAAASAVSLDEREAILREIAQEFGEARVDDGQQRNDTDGPLVAGAEADQQ